MQEKLSELKNKILDEVNKIKSLEALVETEKKYLGRKGELTEILKGLAGMTSEEKKEIGQLANEVKIQAQAEIDKVKKVLEAKNFAEIVKKEWLDVTLPSKELEIGHLNLISKVQNELEDIFSSMGFIIGDGPELESEYYNFDALNIPANHPARDMWDTVFIKDTSKHANIQLSNQNRLLLRTHTSPVQIRAMKKYGAPLNIVVPGTTYRFEATDARHENTFSQIEGLMIGEDISLANLKGVAETFLSQIFKKDIKTRFRPGYFPFVEPGIELDCECVLCNGKGCTVCKGSGWLEIMGAGMVHPKVLEAGGIDPKKYQGFAFGGGIERIAMLLYGINEIRLFRSGDLRFLKQF